LYPDIFKILLMLRKFITLTVTATLLFTLSSHGQDPAFTQFYANPLYLNPALAGANTCPRLILNYRNQWPALSNSFVTYNLSYDQYIDKIRGGIGVLVNTDNAGSGILRTTTVSPMYSFRLQASKHLIINMAVQGTFYQRSLDWNRLQFEDQIDPQQGFINPTSEQPPDNSSVIFPDFSAGAAFDWKGVLHGGFAAHHLLEPNMAFYNANVNKLPIKFTGHLGGNINLGGGGQFAAEEGAGFYISPNVLYQQQGQFHQLNAGVYVVRYPLIIGGWFRHNFENSDAVIVLVGLQYESLKVGYSYDMTLSKLRGNTGGSHEVSVAWQFSCYEKRRRVRAIKCPEF
jgi:type IX secretion system PorP/SprF family membrane protein